MRDEHIISLLENSPLQSLSENELTVIRAHTASCSACLQAFEAAQVSRALLTERAAIEFQPPPFFHTRVLATLRERQTANESWAFGRLWRTAGALASSMVATVATLAILTFVVPETPLATSQMNSLPNGYSAEEVLLEQTPQSEEVSDAQLLSSIYGDEETSR